jgi:hypothetical protein
MSTTANDEIIPLQIVESKDDVFPDVESRPKSVTKKKGKTKVKAKRSDGDILELTSEEEKKKLSRVKKMRHNSEDVDLKVVRIEKTSKKEDSVSTNTADDRKCEKSTKIRSASMSSLSSFKTKRNRPQYFRSQSRYRHKNNFLFKCPYFVIHTDYIYTKH